MSSSATKHLLGCCAILSLLLVLACNKHTTIGSPSNLVYSKDSAIVLNGISDTSVTPMIDWNGRKGTFSFVGQVPPTITIENGSGKISWASSVPIGTYILPVQASNGTFTADTAIYTLIVSGKIITIAGSAAGFSGDGASALDARLNLPYDVTLDPQNNIYIADGGNNRIRKITADGNISTIAGNGTSPFSGDGGPASQANLSLPMGILSDGQGNLYVTDYGNSRIRKIDAGGIITTIAGSDNTNAVNLGDGGPATQAWLYLLGGKVAIDAQGSLYITDFGNQRVRKVTSDGVIQTITGTGNWGAAISDGTSAIQAPIPGPCGVYWSGTSSNLYIVSNLASAIYRLNAGDIYGVAGQTAAFYRPTNIVADAEGNLFVADFGNSRIRKIDAQGNITTVAGNGSPGFSGDGGPAAAAQLDFAYGLAVDANGDLYIADTYNSRIRKVILH